MIICDKNGNPLVHGMNVLVNGERGEVRNADKFSGVNTVKILLNPRRITETDRRTGNLVTRVSCEEVIFPEEFARKMIKREDRIYCISSIEQRI